MKIMSGCHMRSLNDANTVNREANSQRTGFILQLYREQGPMGTSDIQSADHLRFDVPRSVRAYAGSYAKSPNRLQVRGD